MIATVILQDDMPVLRSPRRALIEANLHPGQRVRVDVSPLWSGFTPLIEPDGTGPD